MITRHFSNIKIVFFDIDFTLFDHKRNEFTPSAIKCINKLRDKGIKVIICSGRPYASLIGLGVFDTVPNDGYICTNGGICKIDGEYLINPTIDKSVVKKIIQIASKQGDVVQIMNSDGAFLVHSVNEHVLAFYKNWKEIQPVVKDYDDEDVNSILLFSDPKSDELYKNLPIHFFRFFKDGVDIYKEPYRKSDGVKKVLDHYGFTKDEAMAFGDDIPDIEMFNEVKYSVAMGNAKKEVKEKAFYVTSHISKHGIKKALHHFKLI